MLNMSSFNKYLIHDAFPKEFHDVNCQPLPTMPCDSLLLPKPWAKKMHHDSFSWLQNFGVGGIVDNMLAFNLVILIFFMFINRLTIHLLLQKYAYQHAVST